jgi:hypothetical protein
MARPENPEDYVRHEVEDGLEVYLSRDLLDRQEPGTRKLRFYIGGYGGYDIVLPAPLNERGDSDPTLGSAETAPDDRD